ncbi:spindle and kinetochore-associated protein 1-like [Elysia marginata]|uniref:SKA complex subunit 1 n=1 Tax=Elysia marginata TaxID=1093978 RepID=A0AAV4ICC2_9GAST|nr:spindle and kinetochore-associated protein 1-like [Elysia marginata]
MEISLAEVAEGYTQNISMLKMAKTLLESGCSESLSQPAAIVDELRVELANTSKSMRREELQLKKFEDLKRESAILLERLKYVMENVPTKLPQQKTAVSAQCRNETIQSIEPTKPSVPQVPLVQMIGCQYLDFLTVDEFKTVPKYMKGRLTYDKVNSMIEKLDKVYIEKYKIRRLKKSSLNDVNKKRLDAYRLQETEETKGLYFIVEQDIADFSSLKMDSVLRNIFTILRHCGLIFEIRGGGYTRLVCYSRY